MARRLGFNLDTTNGKVNRAFELVAETNTALEDLELKVAATEETFQIKLNFEILVCSGSIP